jgi:ankyrin repeat protein
MKGDLEELNQLLSTDEGRACINEGDEIGLTPLHWAATNSKLGAVKLLVERGAKVDPISDKRGTPLTQAAKYGFHNIAEYLLSMGASKEKAIYNASGDDKPVVKNFFAEYEKRQDQA